MSKTIKFRCPNVREFDAATGNYDSCQQLLKISSQHSGQIVVCPKCGQDVEVPITEAQDVLPELNDNKPDQPLSPAASRRNVMDIDFQSSETTNSAAAISQQRDRCPKCGGSFSDDGTCQQCDYRDPVRRAEQERLASDTAQIAGFQLWLKSISSEGASIEVLGYFMLAICGGFCTLLVVYGILSTTALGVLIAVVASFGLLGLGATYLKTKELAKNPEASLGMLTPFWELILIVSRAVNWQGYDAKLKGRKIIDKRTSPINDADLQSLTGLKSCQVLDLEGSEISDAGLLHLYGLTHLQCLVLKGTGVTKEGVARLQQSMPRVWIWD